MIKYLRVFYEFFKIGLFAIGGGPATIPFLMELSEKTGWYTMEELTNMIAISESTPGPVGLNMATYVGFKTLGPFGGFVSTVGLTLPSVAIIILIAKFLKNFSENTYVKNAFWGIRPAVTGLILSAVIGMCKASLFAAGTEELSPLTGSIIIAVITFGLLRFKRLSKLHPALWIFGAAALGVIFKL